MSQYFQIHAVNPQPRLVRRCVEVIRDGGIIAYPTDSSYALGCHIGDKAAMERIRRIRRTGKDHDFTLVCSDLTEIALYARVDNWAYRLLKSLTPGPYTFILPATREVPRRLQNPKRRSIGIRVPDHAVPRAILAELGEPIMSSTLMLPGDDLPLTDPELIRDRLGGDVEAVVDSGYCGPEPSTVLDLSDGSIQVRRHGKGDISFIAA